MLVREYSAGPSLMSVRTVNNHTANKIQGADRAVHDWYRFVLSFPPHLVREYLERYGLGARHLVLDPFCGTGTTLVECKKLGIASVGVEANPMACFASRVKTNWNVDPDELAGHAQAMADRTLAELEKGGICDTGIFDQPGNQQRLLKRLSSEQENLILTNSISPLPLHKVLLLLELLDRFCQESTYDHERLALAKTVVGSASNLHFGPEVGVEKPKNDAAVIGPWLESVKAMAEDLRLFSDRREVFSRVFHADSRQMGGLLKPRSVDFVFTSPPYPNEKDYTRTTRLESVVLGFIRTKSDLRNLKQILIRSNTRNVYADDDDDRLVENYPEIQRLAGTIEDRRRRLGKTSGFERLYGRVTKLYFGGMARHLEELKPLLKRGAYLAYVVGDQASYLRVLIRIGQLLGSIAESLGYEVTAIDLFRTRLATATKEHLREEVVLLQWKGERKT